MASLTSISYCSVRHCRGNVEEHRSQDANCSDAVMCVKHMRANET